MEVVDHNELFAKRSTVPCIVNRLNIDSEADKEKLNRLLYTQYEGDSLDVLPRCDCGELKGAFLVGVKCDNCQTVCESITERPLESALWIEAPVGITALINPTCWIILSDALTVSGCNMMEWLCNPMYKPPSSNIPQQLYRLQQLNIPRGYNHFIENFDPIFQCLLDNGIVKGNRQERQDLAQFVSENRHRMFPKYIPIPSSVGFITESTAVGVFADMTMTLAIDAVRSISSITSSVTPLSHKSKELRVVNAISQLAEFYIKFTSKTLSGKYGIFRKHVFGGRAHFTARAVITSISEPHYYEEMHVPWSLSVQLFKVHLTNKMLRLGMTPIEIETHINEHTLKYSPLMDRLFQELISEAPNHRIPAILHRNPSLERASAQRLFITKVKTDVRINTISFSVLALAGPNADFDGDELNVLLILDEVMAGQLDRLAPHLSALDLGKPYSISSNLKIPAPALTTMGHWMH